LIAAAGLKFVRMDLGWSGIERKQGAYDWSAFDELMANLERRGLRALFILDYSNRLYEETVTTRDPASGGNGAMSHRRNGRRAWPRLPAGRERRPDISADTA
jgi:hypothetical protein